MKAEELKAGTKAFAVAVIQLGDDIPRTKTADVIYRQLLRASTSIGANYRAACRARSRVDFISKITIVEEEADESCYWLELFIETGLMKSEHLATLLREANELTAVFTSSGKTAKQNRESNPKLTIRNPK